MALQKRLDYGFNGYQVPPIPRAARSVRRRGSFKRKLDDNQTCAFDLLATVAGKLLSEGENSPAVVEDFVVKDEKNEEKSCDRDCYERNFILTELVSEAPSSNICSNNENDVISRPASGITTSDSSEKLLENDDCKLRLGIFNPSVDVESSGFRNGSSEDEDMKKPIEMDISANNNNNTRNSDLSLASVKFPFSNGGGSLPVNNNRGNNVKLVTRDDDENSSDCTEPTARNNNIIINNNSNKASFNPTSPPRVGDRRIRKFPAASKSCRLGSSSYAAKDDERYNADTERYNYINRKNNNSLKSQRSLRDFPFKKRRLYDCGSSVSHSDQRLSNVAENGTNGGGVGSVPTQTGVNPTPNTAAGGYASFNSRNSPVKLKIKSFRVPELFIEIPESATVGSLKKTVMEAVNGVLGSGLRVGVVVQGKKIRDDNKTLLQTGISHDNKMDTLGFTLEPSPPTPLQLCPQDRPAQFLCDSPQPLARYFLRILTITPLLKNLTTTPLGPGTLLLQV